MRKIVFESKEKVRLTLLFLLSSMGLTAQVTLPPVLSDNMILQQNSEILLWGKAEVDAVRISVSWDEEIKIAPTEKGNGTFSLRIATPAAGGPYRIVFDDGREKVDLENVLIGEVWFCAGQSNMEMPLKGFHKQPVLHSEEIIENANNSEIRIFNSSPSVSHTPLPANGGVWRESSPEVAKNTSAVAFQFADILQKRLKVPVGVIISTWGGTPIKAWMSQESLTGIIRTNEEKPDTVTARTPSALFNGMVAPFTKYNVRGFLWYQGESDHRTPLLYKKLMTAMIADWREKFNDADMPFYYVQIAPWIYSKTGIQFAPYFREIQYELSKELENVGMAVTMDIGSNETIHPPNKTLVAKRLARIALAKTYKHHDTDYLGPELEKLKKKRNKLILSFRNADRLSLSQETRFNNFEVAGKDGNYYPAQVRRVSKGLEVQSEAVPCPFFVRYGFRNFTKGNLFDENGLPASSFRTGTFEMNHSNN